MKKLGPALVVMMVAAGLALAASDAEKPAVPPDVAPSPPQRRADDFDPTRLPALVTWNDQLIARWQERSGTLHTEEATQVFAEAIAKAKEFRAGLEQLSEDFQAGKNDEARGLTAQLREKRPELAQYAATLPTYAELDQAKTLQAERGQDNPDLDARYQRIINLLNKRLDLQKQVGAVNREIFNERQALRQSIPGAPGNAPAAEPPKSEPKAGPNGAP
jgi:hypothetical protein